MSATTDATPFERVNPWRVYAESFILSVIGELSGDAQRRLEEVDQISLRRGERWREVFETEFSVSHALIAAIQAAWDKERAANPALQPSAFANAIAAETFPGVADLVR